MKKLNTTLYVLVTVCILAGFIFGLYRFNNNDKTLEHQLIPTITTNTDVKNISYIVDGESFKLINGIAIKEVAPGYTTKQTVQMFGEPVYGDLNADGESKDAAIMLVSNPGGSGTFYYAVLAINTNGSYKATNALLLGDRIAPQTVEIHDGRAVYNYAERKSGESMTVRPSVGKSLWVNYDIKTGEIGEFVKDFEGEADPSKMKLGMKEWDWVKTQINDGTVITPKKLGAFTILFSDNGSVNIGTDCNRVSGEYKVNGNKIIFSKMASTLMYCEGSQEQAFVNSINNVGGFSFTSKGELIFEIKVDSGVMVFR